MANKKQTNKRRVAAAQQTQHRQAVVNKQDRRRKLLSGGLIAFLALALIAPLTAGLISAAQGDDPVVTATTLPEPVDLPWVPEQFAGATITGPTPCPATDGTSDRTTEFEQSPPLCIDEAATFDLAFDTPAGSFTLPIDSSLDLEAANLVVALSRYRSYEKTPVTAVEGGLLTVGGFGDAGFTIPASPPTGSPEELYPIGSVVALADIDSTVSGSLIVVLEDFGAELLRLTPRHVVVGIIDDVTELQAIFESPEADETILIDSVSVTETS